MHDGGGPGGVAPTRTVGAPNMPGMTGGGRRTGGVTPFWADTYLIDVGWVPPCRGHLADINKVHISLIWCKGGGRSKRGVKVCISPIG
jgi:hypothetical protein